MPSLPRAAEAIRRAAGGHPRCSLLGGLTGFGGARSRDASQVFEEMPPRIVEPLMRVWGRRNGKARQPPCPVFREPVRYL